MSVENNSLSPSQLLVPVALVALVLFLSLAVQTMLVLRDREALHQALTQQEKPLEDSRKVQSQLTALVMGTKKLADGGDKNATAIIGRLQQLGINVGGPPPAPAAPAPEPQQ